MEIIQKSYINQTEIMHTPGLNGFLFKGEAAREGFRGQPGGHIRFQKVGQPGSGVGRKQMFSSTAR